MLNIFSTLFLNRQCDLFIDLIVRKYLSMCIMPGKQNKTRNPALEVCVHVMKNASSGCSHGGAYLDLTLSLSTSKVSGSGSWEHPSPSSPGGFVFQGLLQTCTVRWLFDDPCTQKAVIKRNKYMEQLQWDTVGTSCDVGCPFAIESYG